MVPRSVWQKGFLQGLKANLRGRLTSGLKPRPPKEEEDFWGFGEVGPEGPTSKGWMAR